MIQPMRDIRIAAFLICAIGAAAALARGGEMKSDDPVKRVAENPPVSGMLIYYVDENSDAAKQGLAPGDVIVRFAGDPVTSRETYSAAIKKKRNEKSLEIVVLRERTEVHATVENKGAGIKATAVTKSVPLILRPASTGAMFDFSSLKEKPIDAWYTLSSDGKKIGYEHDRLEPRDGKITVRTEMVFAKQHYVATTVVNAEGRPCMVESKYDFPAADFTQEGKLEKKEDALVWAAKSSYPGEKEPKKVRDERATPVSDDVLPDMGLDAIAGFLVGSTGACAHVSVLNLGAGDIVEESALIITGTGQMEIRAMAQTHRTLFFDAGSRLTGFDRRFYGTRMQGMLSTRETALQGVDAALLPKGD
jgi:hypothetical protein